MSGAADIKVKLEGNFSFQDFEFSGKNRLKGQISIDGFVIHQDDSDSAAGYGISLDGYTICGDAGELAIPCYTRLIRVETDRLPEIRLTASTTDTVNLADYGIRGEVRKVQDKRKNSENRSPASLPTPLSQVVSYDFIGKTRGNYIGWIRVSPFRIDEEHSRILILNRLEFELEWPEVTGEDLKSISSPNPLFRMPAQVLDQSEGGIPEPGAPYGYIILSDTVFRESLKPMVAWKTRMGFEVTELYRGVGGVPTDAEGIRSFLGNLYHSRLPGGNPPVYLLIAGETDFIPPSAFEGHATDLYYAEYDGGEDFLPDLYYGRLPASDTAEMNIMVGKTLQQEKFLYPDPGFLSNVILIAGVDAHYAPSWGNGQVNYMNRYYFNEANGNSVHKYLYPDSRYAASAIRSEFSLGASFINYTGHGYSNRWESPRFQITDIDSLENKDRYPVVIGNGCGTGTYNDPECLAEALVRARDRGAVAYIGCSNDSYWDEDFYWSVGLGPIEPDPGYLDTGPGMYDRLFHNGSQDQSERITSLGQMVYAGNMEAMKGNMDLARYYWEIYHVFGDPSLVPWLAKPRELNVYHSAYHQVNAGEFRIKTEPMVYAGLSHKGILLDGGLTGPEGTLVLKTEGLAGSDTLMLVISGQQRIPYTRYIPVLADSVAFPLVTGFALYDTSGSPQSGIHSGSAFDLKFRLVNPGNRLGGTLSCELIPEDSAILVPESVVVHEGLSTGDTAELDFRLLVPRDTPLAEGTLISCMLEMEDSVAGLENTFHLSLRAEAPEFSILTIEVDDRYDGNGNGTLEPGETALLKLGILNQGSLSSGTVLLNLDCNGSPFSQPDPVLAGIDAGSFQSVAFELSPADTLLTGMHIPLTLKIETETRSFQDTVIVICGQLKEGFQTSSFSTYRWNNTGLIPWSVVPDTKNPKNMLARSGKCADKDTSELFIELDCLAPDSIFFYLKTSSEMDYDLLEFRISGEQLGKWSGETPWTKTGYAVPAGRNRFSWSYIKDVSYSRGYDAAWIDSIVFPETSVLHHNVSVNGISSPSKSNNPSSRVPVTVSLMNHGDEPLSGVPLAYRLTGGPEIMDTLVQEIPPGETLDFTFGEMPDLLEGQEPGLKVYTQLPDDEYRANDSLVIKISNTYYQDVAITELAGPAQDRPSYSPAEQVSIRLQNRGNVIIDEIILLLELDGELIAREICHNTLVPGDSLLYIFSSTVDLSGTGNHVLQVRAIIPYDLNTDDNEMTGYFQLKSDVDPEEWHEGNLFRIYPNPANEQLKLLLTENSGTFSYHISDPAGRIILSGSMENHTGNDPLIIDISMIGAGFYYLMLESETQCRVAAFIKY